MPSKSKKSKKLTEKDQIGRGAAFRATKAVRQAKQSRSNRLDSIMNRIKKQQRRAQATDDHQ